MKSALVRVWRWTEPWTLVAVLMLLWWLAGHRRWVDPVFLPGPEATAASLLQGLREPGGLLQQAGHTLARMAWGWLAASLAGVALGAAIGLSPPVRAWVQPTLEFLRPLPASALIPPAIAIFGLSSGMVLFVVAFGAMWPVLLATLHGISALEPRLREVCAALQLGATARFLKVMLPAAMPDILAGMRLAMTVALIVAVVGEMISAQPGLGQAIVLAARSFRSADLFAGIVVVGLIGLIGAALLGCAERWLLRWQRAA